jgi:inorganic pyrophosphatase
MVDAIIEIPRNSRVKYEIDKTTNLVRVDRILSTPMVYPFNYGFIPNTLSSDNDPLDVILLIEDTLVPGCLIQIDMIGVIYTTDDGEGDPKILAVPSYKVNNNSNPYYQNLNEIPEFLMNKIEYFLTHYKDLEQKKVILNGKGDKDEAFECYQESKQNYVDSLC